MKCEADVSGNVSRHAAPFCGNLSYSQIFLYNLSHCLPVYIHFFCYYSQPTLRSKRTMFNALSTFASVLRFLSAHSLHHPAHLLALHWTAYVIQKHSISSYRIHNKPLLIGLTFHWHFYQSSNKTLYFSAAPHSCHSFLLQLVYHGHELLPLLLRNERLIWSVAHVNIENMPKRDSVYEFTWLNTPVTRYSGN